MAFVLVVISLTLGACSASQVKLASPSETIGPCLRADLKDEGVTEFEGELSRTKGAHLVIQGPRTQWAILSVSDAVKKQDWRGRRVRLSGRRCVYYCGLQEQCLTSGAIHFIQNIKMDVWLHDRWKPVGVETP